MTRIEKNNALTMSVEAAILSANRIARMSDLKLIQAELEKRGIKTTYVEYANCAKLGYPVLKQVRKGVENGWVVSVVAHKDGVEVETRDDSMGFAFTPYEIFYRIFRMANPETRQQRRARERLARKEADKLSKGAGRLRKIIKLDMMTMEIEEVTLSDSAFMRWLDRYGEAEYGIIKVQHMEGLDKKKNDMLKERFDLALDGGIQFNRSLYVPLCVTSSDARNATSVWVKKELHDVALNWMACGVDFESLTVAPNKLYVYLGLNLSSSRPFHDVFGTDIDLTRAVIIRDKKIKVVAPKANLVNSTGSRPVTNREIELNVFDGQALIEADLTKRQACTIRPAFMKGLAVPFPIKQWMYEHNIEGITDIWGVSHQREDIDMIIPESVFKGASWYKHYDQYLDAVESLGREVCVCVQEHKPRSVSLAYQAIQTLVGCKDEDMQALVDHTASVLNAYTAPEKAAKLLGGHMAEAALINPQLMAEPRIAERLQECYVSRLNEAKGAKLLASGVMPFIAADPVAMMEHACGLEVVGKLKADECYCRTLEEGPVVLVRYPQFNNSSFAKLNNVGRPSKEFMGPTLYVSIHDLVAILLRADFDGDHVWISNNKALLNAISSSQEYVNKALADWDAPSAKKMKWHPNMLKDYLRTLTTGSEIGVYSNNATRMWARFDRFSRTGHRAATERWINAADWLERGGNVLIDKTKHGSENVEAPEEVKLTYSTKKCYMDRDGNYYETYEPDKMPGFIYYSKRWPGRIEQTINRAANDYRAFKSRNDVGTFMSCWNCNRADNCYESEMYDHICMIVINGEPTFKRHPAVIRNFQWENGVATRYATLVSKTVPGQLVVDGSEHFRFNSLMLTREPGRKNIAGLCGFGRNVNGEWVDQGLFQRLAFARAGELEAMNGTESYDPTKYHAWAEYRAQIAREQIREFAEEHDTTLEHAYDVIVRTLFGSVRTGAQIKILKDAFWSIFGEMAVETLRMNAAKEPAPLAVGNEPEAVEQHEVHELPEDDAWLSDEYRESAFVMDMCDDPEGDMLAEAMINDD